MQLSIKSWPEGMQRDYAGNEPNDNLENWLSHWRSASVSCSIENGSRDGMEMCE